MSSARGIAVGERGRHSDRRARVDRPVPLAGLIDSLAENHIPEHTQQLLDVRVAVPERT